MHHCIYIVSLVANPGTQNKTTLSALRPLDKVYTFSFNTTPSIEAFSERFRHLSEMDLTFVAFQYTN
jgi:hypothetical protein